MTLSGLKDEDGNALVQTGWAYVIDATPPTVTSIRRKDPLAEATNRVSVTYEVTFSEIVSGVDAGDFRLDTGITGASIGAPTGGGTTWSVTVSGISGNGTLRLNLADDDSIRDAAGNPLGGIGTGSVFIGEIYTIDQTAPTVTSIRRKTPSSELTNATSVTYEVTFSENVSGVNAFDFSLVTTGSASGPIFGSVSGSGSVYTVAFSPVSGSGTLRLNLADDDSIQDAVGNPLGGSGFGNGNFTGGESYTIDQTAPTVVEISDGLIGHSVVVGTSLTYTITFSEDVSPSSVGIGAFANAGTAAVLVSSAVRIQPGVVRVSVTPSTVGTIVLRFSDLASVQDAAGNLLAGRPLDDKVIRAYLPANQILGRAADGSWWYTVGAPGSVTTFAGPVWSNAVTWVDVTSVDLTGDGLHEIVGRVQQTGEWWVSSPNSSGLFTTAKWSTWSPAVTWVDVRFSDLDADGRADVIGRVKETGQWWVGKSTGSGLVNQLWESWSATVTWVDATVVDLDADGRGDILARVKESGDWWVTMSNGSTKGATTKWASWNPLVTWVDVKTGDLNGDGRTDLIARVKEVGEWWAGTSTGTAFTTVKWTAWSPAVTWVDVRLADVTGDGRANLIGRVLETADWWVTQTTTGPATASAGATSKWADWSELVVWKDVVVADFNGDGKQDLAAREQTNGDWWVNLTNATGTGFVVSLFADWATVPWLDSQTTRLRQ